MYSVHGCYHSECMERTAHVAMACCCSRFTGLQLLQLQRTSEQTVLQPTLRSLRSC